MASEIAQRFIEALEESEETHDPTAVADLFSDDADIVRMTGQEHLSGRDAGLRFWTEYLSAFRDIHSDIYNVIEQGNKIVLEWSSEAETTKGKPLAYCGVSILEVDAGRIKRFRTYYDSAKFLQAH